MSQVESTSTTTQKESIRVCNLVSVMKSKENGVFLEWVSDFVSDMVADSITSILLQSQIQPSKFYFFYIYFFNWYKNFDIFWYKFFEFLLRKIWSNKFGFICFDLLLIFVQRKTGRKITQKRYWECSKDNMVMMSAKMMMSSRYVTTNPNAKSLVVHKTWVIFSRNFSDYSTKFLRKFYESYVKFWLVVDGHRRFGVTVRSRRLSTTSRKSAEPHHFGLVFS